MTQERTKRIVTGALPYVNNLPHLGNIVGSLLSADVFTRYSKMRDYETVFVCGTDEYGTTTEIAADKEGISPSELCEKNSRKHKEVYDWFQIEFDHFGRTSCTEHIERTQDIFRRMYERKCFIEKTEKRFFCANCNMFLADRYVSGKCRKCGYNEAKGDQCDGCGVILTPSDIVDPKCSSCASTPEERDTIHLFFMLNQFQERIEKLVKDNLNKWTEAAKTVSLEWCKKEFLPRCITRDLKYKWGVPVPISQYKDKVFYVWFDAPIGYITFLGMIGKSFWMNNSSNTQLYEFMGKDNVFFHSIFFPAMLLGTGDNYLYPNMISATHYLQYEGGKFSKSLGRGIFGHTLLGDSLGPAGVWRFHLMRTRPETGDTDFSWIEFHETLHAILINTIGNFCFRVLSYLKKRSNKTLSEAILPEDIKNMLALTLQEYIDDMERTEIRSAIGKVIEIAGIGNRYIQQAFSDKCSPEVMQKKMSAATNIILLLSRVLMPITPKEAKSLQNMLGVTNGSYIPDKFTEDLVEGHIMNEPSILFSPLTNEQIKRIEEICTRECPFKQK